MNVFSIRFKTDYKYLNCTQVNFFGDDFFNTFDIFFKKFEIF